MGADLIVTMGGASVGDHDLVLPVAKNMGFEFKLAKIAMRPGKPFLFGTLVRDGRTIRLAGLAGNPVSSLVAGNVFVKPLIKLLAGYPYEAVEPVSAVLGVNLPQNDERAEYLRAQISGEQDGRKVVIPFEKQDSSMLALLSRADCLMLRPVNAPPAQKGDPCQIIPVY